MKITLSNIRSVIYFTFSGVFFVTLVSMFLPSVAHGQNQFEQIEWVGQKFSYTSVSKGDYNRDGWEDLIISGAADSDHDGSPDLTSTRLYINGADGFTEFQIPELYDTHFGSTFFVDIDNDGDLDIIVNGINYAEVTNPRLLVYENQDDNYTLKQDLGKGRVFQCMAIGDYDNDGYIDFIISGHDYTELKTTLFRNNKGTFEEVEMPILPNVQNGDMKFVDIDNDMDLDLIIMGISDNDNERILKVFENEDGVFTEKQSLSGVGSGNIAVADYDGDGFQDFAVIGDDDDFNEQGIVYRNVSGHFEQAMELVGAKDPSSNPNIMWGDVDNDGDFDLLYGGVTGEDYLDTTCFFRNNNGTLVQEPLNFEGVGGGVAVMFIDIDNDNDLDLFLSGFGYDNNANYVSKTMLFRNLCETVNQPPTPPTNIQIVKERAQDYVISWTGAADQETDTLLLRYKISVGSSSGLCDIASYVVTGNSWRIKNVAHDNIFVSVQAIDAADNYSEYSEIFDMTGVVELPNNRLSIIPNPASNYFSFESDEAVKNVVIYNLMGNMIKCFAPNQRYYVADLKEGIYFVVIETTTKKRTSKLVIAR